MLHNTSMKAIQRQGIANTIISYLGIGLGFLNMAVLFPNILSTEQIGLYAVLGAATNIAVNFARLGGNYVVIRYFPFYRDNRQALASFTGFLFTHSMLGFALFLLFYLIGKPFLEAYYNQQSPMFADYSQMIIPFVLFMILFEFFYHYSRSIYKTIVPTFIRDVLWRLMILSAIVAFHFQLIAFHVFVWIYVCSYALPTLLLVVYLMSQGDINFRFNLREVTNKREILVYGGFMLVGTMSTVLISDIDKMMLAGMLSLDATGIYGVTAFFGSVILTPARSIIAIAAPVIAEHLKTGAIDKVDSIYKKSSLNQLIIGALLYVGIVVNLDNVFEMLPPEFEQGKYVIILLGLSRLFDMGMGVNGEILVNSPYFKFDLIFNLVLVVLAVVTNALFIPIYGISGAALATLLSISLFNVMRYLLIWYKYRIQPFSIQTLYVVLTAGLMVGVNYLIPVMDMWVIDLVVRSTIITAIYGAIVLRFRFSEDINNLVAKFLPGWLK